MRLGQDIKNLYAGPKEAVMHPIYRQDLGFTGIVIGCKRADDTDTTAPAYGMA